VESAAKRAGVRELAQDDALGAFSLSESARKVEIQRLDLVFRRLQTWKLDCKSISGSART
jgi:hypothetical protein